MITVYAIGFIIFAGIGLAIMKETNDTSSSGLIAAFVMALIWPISLVAAISLRIMRVGESTND